MENFNKESTSQQPYWNPENRAAGASSSSGTAARMKLADKAGDIKIALPTSAAKLWTTRRFPRNSCRRSRRHSLNSPYSRRSNLRRRPLSRQQNTRHRQLRSSDQRQGMVGDFEDILKRYPAQTLAAAAFLGFLVGGAFRRYD